MIKILFLGSHTFGRPELQLTRESTAICEVLRRSSCRECFRFEQTYEAQLERIAEQILEHRPSVFHFSGHGNRDGQLIFQDQFLAPSPADQQVIADVFRIHNGPAGPRVVVLNACYTASQAELILEHVDAVVGMDQAIGDLAAEKFSVGFYHALGEGRSVGDAFESGKNRVELAGIDIHGPVLLVKAGVDPMSLYLLVVDSMYELVLRFSLSIFLNPDELLRELRNLEGGDELLLRLPADKYTKLGLYEAAAADVVANQLLNGAWFDALARGRPGRKADIDTLAAKWKMWLARSRTR